MAQCVLLLHGPMLSRGINPITQNLHNDAGGREQVRSVFNCDQNVLAMSYVYRQCGFKVIYSGWSDDAEWLEANRDAFDYLVISDQSTLAGHSIANGETVVNNKEKLYYGALRGLQVAQQELGNDVLVFRLRSDVAVNHVHAVTEINRLRLGGGILLVEYMNMHKEMAMPDFMLMGELLPMLSIYADLYQRSASGNGYHVSSHVDHCFAYLKAQEDKVLKAVVFMGKPIFDSVVWRGVPRYLEYVFPDYSKNLAFDSMMMMREGLTVDKLLATVPPQLSGRQPPR
jgi:hypothetical protein